MRKIVSFLREEIERGSRLWEAMEQTGAFKADYIAKVKAFEESGENASFATLFERLSGESGLP